jgi:hypothetical protein
LVRIGCHTTAAPRLISGLRALAVAPEQVEMSLNPAGRVHLNFHDIGMLISARLEPTIA